MEDALAVEASRPRELVELIKDGIGFDDLQRRQEIAVVLGENTDLGEGFCRDKKLFVENITVVLSWAPVARKNEKTLMERTSVS